MRVWIYRAKMPKCAWKKKKNGFQSSDLNHKDKCENKNQKEHNNTRRICEG